MEENNRVDKISKFARRGRIVNDQINIYSLDGEVETVITVDRFVTLKDLGFYKIKGKKAYPKLCKKFKGRKYIYSYNGKTDSMEWYLKMYDYDDYLKIHELKMVFNEKYKPNPDEDWKNLRKNIKFNRI
jgi:hypothetical protein